MYNIAYAFLTGMIKAESETQIYLILCLELLFYACILVLQPHLDRSSLNVFVIVASFIMRILSCVFMLGLIPESSVEKELGVEASADLLIVSQTILILLNVIPLFVMYTVLPLIALMCYKSKEIIEDVKEIELLPPSPTKKYERTPHEIKVIILELDGLLTKVRDPRYERCFDFNETLLEQLGGIEKEARLSSIPTKYFILDKNHLFQENRSGNSSTLHSSTMNLSKISRTQIGTTMVNWIQKETSFEEHLVDVYVEIDIRAY